MKRSWRSEDMCYGRLTLLDGLENMLLDIIKCVVVSWYESNPVVHSDAIRHRIPLDEIGRQVKQAEN
jgi:hypothetical protein